MLLTFFTSFTFVRTRTKMHLIWVDITRSELESELIRKQEREECDIDDDSHDWWSFVKCDSVNDLLCSAY